MIYGLVLATRRRVLFGDEVLAQEDRASLVEEHTTHVQTTGETKHELVSVCIYITIDI